MLPIRALSITLVAVLLTAGCSTRRTVYWPAGAIFSQAGDWVYFVTRKTDATERGSSGEFQVPKGGFPLCQGGSIFEPMHHVTVWSDEVTLRRTRLADGFTEELIHWPSTPLTGTTGDVNYSFCYVATAALDWEADQKLRIGISLMEGLSTYTSWTGGVGNDAPAFTRDSGYGPGHLDIGSVHGDLEVIPLRGDDYVAAIALYNGTKPEVRVIALDPPGASFRTAQYGSTLQAAMLFSRRAAIEDARRFRNLPVN